LTWRRGGRQDTRQASQQYCHMKAIPMDAATCPLEWTVSQPLRLQPDSGGSRQNPPTMAQLASGGGW
jgi:hypothetical protein